MEPIEVKDTDFQSVVENAEKPVVLDVWAPWCGPCKMVGPALKRLAVKDPGRFQVVLANMEEFESTAETLNVKATPTLVLFHKGKEVTRRSGAMMESQISQWLEQHLPEDVLGK